MGHTYATEHESHENVTDIIYRIFLTYILFDDTLVYVLMLQKNN